MSGESAEAGRTVSPLRQPLTMALALVIVLVILLSPWPLMAKLQLVGHACCAQAPARTLRIDGHLLPLDARDTGLYLSLLVGMLMSIAVGRGRSGGWPSLAVTALLGGLFLAMVLDGINSSLQTRGLHAFYQTTNTIRLLTGVGAGLALAVLGLPLFNRLIWRQPSSDPIAADYGELSGFAIGAAAVAGALLAPPARLYTPLALLSVLGVLTAWSLVNTAVVTVALRREGRSAAVADLVPLTLAGLVLTLAEIALIDWLRGPH